jgi:lipopolysaccharide transport system permease protein
VTERVRVYTSESKLRRPQRLLFELWNDKKTLFHVSWRILARDLRAQYRQSFFGWFWILVPPVVMSFIFIAAHHARVFKVAEMEVPYPAYVIVSMVLWQTFVESMLGPVQGMIATRSMIGKVDFPRESILLSKLGEVCVNLIVKGLIVAGVWIYYDAESAFSLVAAAAGIVGLIALGFGIGVIVVPLGILAQDVVRGLNVVTRFWMFVTPVIYPLAEPGTLFGTVMAWNPATYPLLTARAGIIGGDPALSMTALVILSSVALCLVGIVLFRISMPVLAERSSG